MHVTASAATGAAVVAVAAAVLTGCTGNSAPTSGSPATSSPPSTSPSAFAADCPDVTAPDGSFAAIDYVDFVHAFGRQYVARNLGRNTASAGPVDLGRVVLRSKCSFSALNDRTHKSPGEPRDGDTGFLPPGTPIYALRGRPTACVLAAEQDGHVLVYLAYRDDTHVATPRRCATRHWGDTD
jgi:hypothetical protein